MDKLPLAPCKGERVARMPRPLRALLACAEKRGAMD